VKMSDVSQIYDLQISGQTPDTRPEHAQGSYVAALIASYSVICLKRGWQQPNYDAPA